MSFTGLNWQTVQIPLAAGMDTKTDARAMQPPGLLVCKDVVFDEPGGLQTRKPTASIGTSIYPSGTISNIRRIYQWGNELVCFTKDTLYTWNANLSKWVSRGTHLAVKTTETPVFITTGDQITNDRAELSGHIFYTWTDAAGLHVGAVDKTTGSVVYESAALPATRGRLVAMSGANKVALFFKATADGSLTVTFFSADDPQAGGADETAILAGGDFNDYYDVVVDSSGLFLYVACRRDTTTSYELLVVEEDGTLTDTATIARTCDGPIAIALAPNSTHLTVIRDDGTDIEGDYIAISGLTDVTVNQAIGTSTGNTTQIAAAYRSTTDSGEYRCYVFWNSATESESNTSWSVKYNYADTGGTIGTQDVLVDGLGIASRAFDHEGRIFVNLVFAGASQSGVAGLRGQLQNTYFLFRDDALLVAKQCMHIGGGYRNGTSLHDVIGLLPGVQSLGSSVYAWCATERRVIPLGEASFGYSDRGPRDVTITFDSNEARRVAAVGRTLYITGAEVMQFDGNRLVELGFHWFPWTLLPVAAGSGGNLEAGTYTYKATWRWDNAKGERDRSTTATTRQVTCVGSDEVAINSLATLTATHKTSMAVEIWRTVKNPDVDSAFYLVTSQDPAGTGDNPFVAMPAPDSGTAAVTSIPEVLSDANLIGREPNNENGGILESLTPPPAHIIAATEDRLFLAGIPGEPDNVWYSKLRTEGYVAQFHDALKISIPKAGGDITALAFLNDTLVVFRESAVYLLPGEGFDNTGGGSNYGPARSISQDIGAVSAEAVALTPQGLIFKSSKGWYLLNRGFGLDYVGSKAADYDSDTIYAVHVIETNHHVRIVTSGRVLCWDYNVNEWSEWTITDAVHGGVWNGTWHECSTSAVRAEQTTYTGTADSIDITTGWIKVDGLMGAVAIRRLHILGEYRSAHRLRAQVYYNYVETVVDDKTWTVTPTTVGNGEQLIIGLSRPKCQAIKVRIFAIQTGSSSAPTDEALKLTGLGLDVGIRGRLNGRFPSGQRI